MRATDWEFRNRAWLFGLVCAVSFPLYAVDSSNATAALANSLFPIFEPTVARALFAGAAAVAPVSFGRKSGR